LKSLAVVLVCASRIAFAQAPEPNTWRYDATIDGTPRSVTTWEGGNEVFAGVPAFFLQTVTISPDGDKRIDERAYYQNTKDGIALLGTRTANEVGAATTVDERTAVTPPVALPAALAVGAKWDATTSVRAVLTHAGAAPVASAGTLHVVGEAIGNESVTVPAGTFDCIVVRDTSTTQTADGDEVAVTTRWYAAKVGLIQANTTTTITTTRGVDTSKRETTQTLQLRAYRVPRPPWQMSSVGLVPAGEPAPSEPAPTATATAQAPAPAPPPATAPAPPPVDDKNDRHRRLGRRIVIVGGIVAGMGLGLGIVANSSWSTAQSDCGGNIKNCTAGQLQQAKIDTDSARSYANFATGFFIAGAALAATGAYVWLSTPSDDKVQIQPSVTPTAAAVTLSGRW
jgi:hypothetical protein